MADWMEFTAKTADEALTDALIKLETTSDKIEYEIVEKETSGLLGLFSKPARIRVRKKENPDELAKGFLDKVFNAMDNEVAMEISFDESENILSINLTGKEMGLLIGKRGQTLDSLQYLTSLVVNRYSEKYIKIKLDTENYRKRRNETIENLAKNIASKVKKTRKTAYLEPMNPYERRIIHSTLQGDKLVETHSEGEEPNRKVVVTCSKELLDSPRRNNYRKGGYNKGGYNKKRTYNKDK